MIPWYVSYAFNSERGLKVSNVILHLDCEHMTEEDMLETISTIEDCYLPDYANDSYVTILNMMKLEG